MRYRIDFLYTNGKKFRAQASSKPIISKQTVKYLVNYKNPERHIVQWTIPIEQISTVVILDKRTGEISSNTIFKRKVKPRLQREQQYD